MSGVIVERRDQVLITGGRLPPARTFSTAFKTLSSMYGPFLTERAICLHCRFPIANCQFQNHSTRARRPIGNRHLAIGNAFTWFFCPSKSFAACVYYFSSCNRASVVPTALPGYGRRKFFLHRRHADGPPGSWLRREHAGECPSSVNGQPYHKKRFRARCCQPGPP